MTKLENCGSIHKESGNWYYCQLPKGHGGKHTYGLSWSDNE